MHYIFKLDICINKKTKQNRQKKNLVLDMLNQVYSYLQGPVPKMWTTHTATHALKLLTELKEYTDMKKKYQ